MAQRWCWLAILSALLLVGCGAGGARSGGLLDTGSTSDLGTTPLGSSTGSDGAPGAGIFGRVVDTNNTAVAGAEVVLEDDEGHVVAGPATTDELGKFSLPVPPAAAPPKPVLVVKRPHHDPEKTPIELEAGKRKDVKVELQHNGPPHVGPANSGPGVGPQAGPLAD